MKRLSFIIAVVAVLGLVSCEKVVQVAAFENLGIGSYLTKEKTTKVLLNFTKIATEAVSIDVKEKGTAVEKITIYVNEGSATRDKTKWKKIKDVPYSGTTTLNVTAAEIATALGVSINTMVPGKQYTLYNEITTKDGQVYSLLNTNAEFESNANYNMALRWTASVVCPFVPADAAGTYKIVVDGWDGAVGELATVTTTSNTAKIDLLFPFAANPGLSPVTVDVDVATGTATVKKQIYGSYGASFQNFTAQGGGLIFSCVGKIQLRLQHLLGSRDYGFYNIELQKQ